MSNIKCEINRRLVTENNVDIACIDYGEVHDAIKRLNAGKNDGDIGMYSNHILLANEIFMKHISNLFSMMLSHGFTPEDIIRAVITSIPKNVKESVACSENYRGIALSSILGKVFDLIIIQRYGHALSSSDLQFSFKERHSTVMCSAAIKEATSHYLQNQSDVYACMLDATKAFDKVSFTKLFALLLKRDIPAIILRVVLDLYTRQSVVASWNGCTSNPFSVTNGVRQGGVLSPILFNLYMDELIDKLKMNDVGCHIGRQFTGAFCYADDLTLLSPTIRGLQKMLNVCDDFANEYSVKFNARKTVCMCFSRKPTCRDINVLLSGEKLHWSNHVKHLGNTLSHNLSDEIDVQVKRGHFYGFVNTLCAKFKCVLGDLDLTTKLFMSYCCSFYGSQLWDLSSTWFDAICVAWNKAVRRIFQLPYNTHRFLLPYVVDGNPIRDQLLKRCVKFYESCDESKHSIIQLLVSNANFENTPMGINMRYIAMHSKSKVKVDSEKDGAGHLLHSLLKIREQYWEICDFTREEVECMVYNVCTS